MKPIYRKILCILFLTALLCACSEEENNTALTADDPSQMPDIVFFNIINYKAYAPDGEYESAMTFYDKV